MTRKRGRTSRGVDRGRAQKRAEQKQQEERGSFAISLPEGMEFFKPEKGKMVFDILPYEVSASNHPDGYEPGDLFYRRPYGVHRNIGVDDNAVICPRLTIGKKCPICEEHSALKRRRDVDEDEVKALRASERELFNVIDEEGDHLIWDMSRHLFGKLLDEEIRELEDDDPWFPDLEGGASLAVRFKMDSFAGNKFPVASKIDFIERDEDYKEAILDEMADLDKLLNVLPYEALTKLFLEIEDEDEDAPPKQVEEEEEPEEKKEKKERKKKQRKKEEEDEDPPEEPIYTSIDMPRTSDELVEMVDTADDRLTLCSIAHELDVLDDIPAKLSGLTNDTEKGLEKLRKEVLDLIPDDYDEEEPDPEPKRGKKGKKGKEEKKEKKGKKGKSDDPECPGGGTFGKDNNKLDECDACEFWDDCAEASD